MLLHCQGRQITARCLTNDSFGPLLSQVPFLRLHDYPLTTRLTATPYGILRQLATKCGYSYTPRCQTRGQRGDGTIIGEHGYSVTRFF